MFPFVAFVFVAADEPCLFVHFIMKRGCLYVYNHPTLGQHLGFGIVQ